MNSKKIITIITSFLIASSLASSAAALDSIAPNGQAGIVFASADWSALYFMDVVDQGNFSDATNVIVNDYGTYTVSVNAKTYTDYYDGGDTVIDGTEGLAYAAIEIVNGESLYPDSVISIDSVKLDGVEITLNGTPYTASPDGISTYVSLYNEWEPELPESARGVSLGASPKLIDGPAVGEWQNLTVTFTLKQTNIESQDGVSTLDTKGSPDTGISDVYLAAGVAVLAAGSLALIKKK